MLSWYYHMWHHLAEIIPPPPKKSVYYSFYFLLKCVWRPLKKCNKKLQNGYGMPRARIVTPLGAMALGQILPKVCQYVPLALFIKNYNTTVHKPHNYIRDSILEDNVFNIYDLGHTSQRGFQSCSLQKSIPLSHHSDLPFSYPKT